MPTVTCFGEVLWDVFPTHKKIGGAPLNVALRLKSFGVDAHIVSRIGKDQNGQELKDYVLENTLDISTIQVDEVYKTGAVNVTLDAKGSATYEIEYPVAWDKIEFDTASKVKVKESDAFIFGSLACRDATSKQALLSLLEHAKFKVFDVNLRPPYYSMELLMELMKKADLIKCNDDELKEICTASGFERDNLEEQVRFLAKKTKTAKICITMGADGALLFIQDVFYVNKGYSVEVTDTVGAGDSFLASLIAQFLFKTAPQDALDFATAVGTLVASKSGANPTLSESQISNFRKELEK